MKGKHIKVQGIVQGVGFRFYTSQLAKKYHIVGSVENVSDFVEIYAYGDAKELDSFSQAIIEGPAPTSKVDNYSIDDIETDEDIHVFRTL